MCTSVSEADTLAFWLSEKNVDFFVVDGFVELLVFVVFLGGWGGGWGWVAYACIV